MSRNSEHSWHRSRTTSFLSARKISEHSPPFWHPFKFYCGLWCLTFGIYIVRQECNIFAFPKNIYVNIYSDRVSTIFDVRKVGSLFASQQKRQSCFIWIVMTAYSIYFLVIWICGLFFLTIIDDTIIKDNMIFVDYYYGNNLNSEITQ